MGIRLVSAALGPQWLGLSERARLTLARMCLVAHDTGTPNTRRAVWWEGRDALILGVLGQDPDLMTPTEHRTAATKIKRVMQELRAAGAIELLEPACKGRNASYRLHVEHPALPVDNSEHDQINGKHWGAHSTPTRCRPSWRTSRATRHASATPSRTRCPETPHAPRPSRS